MGSLSNTTRVTYTSIEQVALKRRRKRLYVKVALSSVVVLLASVAAWIIYEARLAAVQVQREREAAQRQREAIEREKEALPKRVREFYRRMQKACLSETPKDRVSLPEWWSPVDEHLCPEYGLFPSGQVLGVTHEDFPDGLIACGGANVTIGLIELEWEATCDLLWMDQSAPGVCESKEIAVHLAGTPKGVQHGLVVMSHDTAGFCKMRKDALDALRRSVF